MRMTSTELAQAIRANVIGMERKIAKAGGVVVTGKVIAVDRVKETGLPFIIMTGPVGAFMQSEQLLDSVAEIEGNQRITLVCNRPGLATSEFLPIVRECIPVAD